MLTVVEWLKKKAKRLEQGDVVLTVVEWLK